MRTNIFLLAVAVCSSFTLSGCGHHSRRSADVAATGGAPSTDKRVSDQHIQGSAGDIAITERLRKAILADPAMSVDARNIFIYTRNGAVTLQGAVASQSEQEQILSKLQAVPGIKRVENHLQPLTTNEVSDGNSTQ